MTEITSGKVVRLLDKGIKPGVGPANEITVSLPDGRAVYHKIVWGEKFQAREEFYTLIARYNIGQAEVFGVNEFYNVEPEPEPEPMTTLTAINIIECDENATVREQLLAWAYLIASGMCWQLQGSYHRGAIDLISRGFISAEGEIDWSAVENEAVDLD